MRDRSPTPCPSFEDLSAWYDRELSSEQLDSHVAKCTQCREAIDAFDAIDRSLARYVTGQPAPVERLLAKCRSELARQRRPARLLTFPAVLRVAATIALAALVVEAVYLWRRPTANSEVASSEPVPAAVDTSVAAVPRPSVVVSAAVDSMPEAIPAMDSPALDFGTMDLVSTTGGGLRRVRNPGIVSVPERVVKDYVHHVWVVNDATDPLRALMPLLPQHEPQLSHWVNQGRDRYRLQLSIVDRDLQRLVNHFDQQGYILLSPAAPQPGAFPNLELSGKVVLYEVDFVSD